MMFRLLTAAVAIAAVFATDKVVAGDAGAQFQRGINISMVFIFPEKDGWPPFRNPKADISDGELHALAEAGFDFIRLPIYPPAFDRGGPRGRRQLLGEVADFVERANQAGLAVMVAGYSTHSPTAWLPERDGETGRTTFEDYARWLKDVTRAVDAITSGPGAAIELMNEPQSVCVNADGTDWAVFQMSLHARVRAVTDLPIVLTGGCWSNIEGLIRLSALPDDPNTLFDVHYYAPFPYTHQGATWATPILAYVGGLAFPPEETELRDAEAAVAQLVADRHEGTPQEAGETVREAHAEIDRYLAEGNWPQRIGEDFADLAAWADRHDIARDRIILGEFGAIRPQPETSHDRASRKRYLASVRRVAEAEGFGWAMWEYYSPFGLLETDESRRLSPGILKALGLETR